MIRQPLNKIRHIARSIGKIDHLIEMLETLTPTQNDNPTPTLSYDVSLFTPHILPQAYGDDIPAVTQRMMMNRDKLLKSYIRSGKGIEIGALHNPAAVPDGGESVIRRLYAGCRITHPL